MASNRDITDIMTAMVTRLNAAPITTTHEVRAVSAIGIDIESAIEFMRPAGRVIYITAERDWQQITGGSSPLINLVYTITTYCLMQNYDGDGVNDAIISGLYPLIQAVSKRLANHQLYTTAHDCTPMSMVSETIQLRDDGWLLGTVTSQTKTQFDESL